MPNKAVIPGQLGMATPFGELLGASTAEMNAELADYVSMGVDWVRIDLHWSLVQPTANGGFNWGLVDRVFNAIADAGLEIVAVLNNVPNWVDDGLSGSAAQQAFANFARAAAQRYGDIVDFWEIINEPNKAGIDPADYTAVLKGAYSAIKSVDPDDVVITGGTAAVPQTGNGMWGAVDYLKQIYANGGGDYFDAVGYHPYSFPLMPGNGAAWNGWQIMEDGLRQTMIANGDADKQIWMTEMGAPTWGQSVTVTEAEQVQILREAVDLASGYDWAGPIMWFGYQDSTLDRGFGLLDSNGNAKASYAAYKTLALADDAVPPPVTQTPLVNDVEGTDGADHIETGAQDDKIRGFAGNDTLRGHDGNDTLLGSSGDDYLAGGRGNDMLSGSTGKDNLRGNAGNDTLDGGYATDYLAGGTGSDVFRFRDKSGNDVISDFEQGVDLIDLSRMDADSTRAGVQDFNLIGGNWLQNAGDLGVYVDAARGYTYVQGDLNGDGAPDFSIRLNGIFQLGQDDFIF